MNGLASRSVQETNCDGDGTTLLDNLQSLFRQTKASSSKPFTRNIMENCHDPRDSFHVADQVQQTVIAAAPPNDTEVFSVAYVSDLIARKLLLCVNCGARNMSDFSS
jgi:hypothetical protein